MRILIAYGSKHGSTKEIAEQIADVLRADGLAADVCAAGDLDDLTGYDAAVIGGALYYGHWHREARHLVKRLHDQLCARSVWLFSSGPLDNSAAERDLPAVGSVARIADRIGARGHITFGGRLDAQTPGFVARGLARRGLAGDYRDTAQITRWAHSIASQAKAGPKTLAHG